MFQKMDVQKFRQHKLANLAIKAEKRWIAVFFAIQDPKPPTKLLSISAKIVPMTIRLILRNR